MTFHDDPDLERRLRHIAEAPQPPVPGSVFEYAGEVTREKRGSKVRFSLGSPFGRGPARLASGLAIAAAMQLPSLNARVGQTAGLFSGNYAQANAATSQRLPIWKVAVRVVEDHWINGIGPRGFRYIYPQYGEKDDPFLADNPNVGPNHPHQLLLEIATETGLIGVIGYLAALIYWVRLMLGTARKKKGVALSVMGGVLIAIMPINAHMAFYASFWSCITWWLMMLGLALWQTAPAEKHP